MGKAPTTPIPAYKGYSLRMKQKRIPLPPPESPSKLAPESDIEAQRTAIQNDDQVARRREAEVARSASLVLIMLTSANARSAIGKTSTLVQS